MSKMRPNVVALTSALGACSENSDLWIGKQIYCVALRFGLLMILNYVMLYWICMQSAGRF